ncbi:MAG TPA: MFS transporter [Methylomirabilota bacterium]|nr:MFS transporter [Methylomirabilota bacterium]
MSTRSNAAQARIFYGWWVALAFSLIVFLSTGIRFTVGPFLKPVVADLGLDRGSFSLVISLSLFLYGAFMPLVGRLVDRMGPRLVCSAGAFVLAGAMVLTGMMHSLWQFFLFYGVLAALGLAATGHVVAAATLTRWFVKRRGTAISFLSAASMAGMAILVPVAMWCILTFGWRTSYMILGVASLIVTLPLTLWVLKPGPESLGLEPDGAVAEPGAQRVLPALERTTVGEAIQVPSFWLLAGGLFNCGFSMSLLSAHGVPMLTDHGFHAMTASSAVGFLGMTSIAGGMTLGMISDHWGRKPVLASVYILRACAFSALFVIRDPVGLMIVAAIGGLGMSGSLAMTSALTGDIFGRFSVGSIFGLIFLSHQAGAALGSWLAGFLFDLTGGYGAAFAAACTLLLVAGGLALTINEAARPAGRAEMQPVRSLAGGR